MYRFCDNPSSAFLQLSNLVTIKEFGFFELYTTPDFTNATQNLQKAPHSFLE